ncbi:unnamed protein product [Brassica napus]|uniref:(rape) hypothetical protein n=1 Tax=Brassica napus TaxID=3708 RepID=A0A816K338_BRANA|nr:unnamed protein product [Brassica napus]
MRKTKGRLKTKMVKIEKEKNLQVTFCKRKNGLFKKANELCTLCNARVAIILFSPSGKIFSFGHTKVETIIDRFKKTDHPDSNTQSNMQLGEIHQNSTIRGLNNRLTEILPTRVSSNAPFGVDGNVNAFDNHNMVLSIILHHFHPNPNESGNEHPHDGHPPQPRSD